MTFIVIVVLAIIAVRVFSSAKKTVGADAAAPGSKIRHEIPPSTKIENLRWVGHGQPVSIAGVGMASGLLYLAKLPTYGYGPKDGGIIDPNMPVSESAPGVEPELPYYPRYSQISPQARRVYLDWLASGRSDPDIGIGYVFMFFYGLERRIFFDRAVDERDVLLEEVERLLSIYGGNQSFHGYASTMRDTALAWTNPSWCPDPARLNAFDFAYPLPALIHLGRRVRESPFISADDALIWLMAAPSKPSQTVMERCFDEFAALWSVRFGRRYPKGMKVRIPKGVLSPAYRASSGDFTARLEFGDGAIPDISRLEAPVKELLTLAGECADALASYSRFIGRNPGARGSIEARALLPDEIADLADIGEGFDRLLAQPGPTAMALPDLAARLGISLEAAGKTRAAVLGQIGMLLDKLGIGYEPDKRYGPSAAGPDDTVIIFRARGGALVDPARPAYQAARTMIEIAALAASADGVVTDEERASIAGEIGQLPELDEVERMRLNAHASALLANGARQQGAMKRLAALPEEKRRSVLKTAFSAVLADGRVDASEVRFLEQLHKALGLPMEDVYGALHRGHVHIDEPVTVLRAEETPGIPIPPKPEEGKAGALAIDETRLERIRNETSAVSSLLAGIFAEEKPVEDKPVAPPPAHHYDGLDEAHGALLAALAGSGKMDRGVFEAECAGLRLLPDGAIETINDWGFDHFGEPAIEDDDDIVIPEHIASELAKLETGS